jgi:preprotein translocase subunit YajC
METILLALPDLPEPKPAEPGGFGGLGSFLPILLVLFVMMLLMPLFSRKERTRQKRLLGLKKHDRVVTSGGLFGTVISFDEKEATLEVAKGVRLTFKRSSIYDIEKQGEGAPTEAPEKQAGAKG